MANTNRINGIIDRVSNAENIEDINWILGEPVINLSESVVDRYVETNAKFQARAGIKSIVKREMHGETCEWCRQRAGSFVINEEDLPDGFWARHENCDCTITYRGDKMKRSGNAFVKPDKEVIEIKNKEKKYLSKEESIKALKKLKLDTTNLDQVDEKVLSDTTKRLQKLDKKYKVLQTSEGSEIAYIGNNASVASTTSHIFDEERMHYFALKATEYTDYNKFYLEMRRMANDKWFLPCSEDNLTSYVITHEYGHAFEFDVAYKRLGNILELQEDLQYVEYKNIYNELFDIIDRIKKTDLPTEVVINNNISKYPISLIGSDEEKHFEAEFFAECFANAHCEVPNILGKAMKIWLKDNGY